MAFHILSSAKEIPPAGGAPDVPAAPTAKPTAPVTKVPAPAVKPAPAPKLVTAAKPKTEQDHVRKFYLYDTGKKEFPGKPYERPIYEWLPTDETPPQGYERAVFYESWRRREIEYARETPLWAYQKAEIKIPAEKVPKVVEVPGIPEPQKPAKKITAKLGGALAIPATASP